MKKNKKLNLDENNAKEEKIDNIKKENKISKKTIIFSLLAVTIFLIGIISFIIIEYPKIRERIELKLIDKEIKEILKTNNLEKANEKFKDNLTSGDRLILENDIEKYLIENLKIKNELNDIKNNEKIITSLDIENIGKEDILSYYDEVLKKLDEINNKVKEITEENKKYTIKDDTLNNKYQEFSKKINDEISFTEIDEIKTYIDSTKPILKYLIDNKSYYKVEDNKLIFLKRNKKEGYDTLINNIKCDNCNIVKSNLIEDKEGPVINASNITIVKGTKLNIKDKVTCVDKVDDNTECIITGTFDSNKVGTYKITIKSTDKSNNTSTKAINVIVKEKEVTNTRVNTNNKPYYIEVIRNQNVVIVYGLDSNKQYTKVVKVFVVSVGKNGKTPTGTFKTTKGLPWGSLIGGVWGQYSTRITGSYLFHSVPYYSKNKGDLEWQEYNKLGTAASAGCVRMTVRDVKWIYDNVASGTTVKIYDGKLPSGITKPTAQKIPANSPNKGWDPTDPDPNNPWKK